MYQNNYSTWKNELVMCTNQPVNQDTLIITTTELQIRLSSIPGRIK